MCDALPQSQSMSGDVHRAVQINKLMINNCIQCMIVEIKAKRSRFLSKRHHDVSALL